MAQAPNPDEPSEPPTQRAAQVPPGRGAGPTSEAPTLPAREARRPRPARPPLCVGGWQVSPLTAALALGSALLAGVLLMALLLRAGASSGQRGLGPQGSAPAVIPGTRAGQGSSRGDPGGPSGATGAGTPPADEQAAATDAGSIGAGVPPPARPEPSYADTQRQRYRNEEDAGKDKAGKEREKEQEEQARERDKQRAEFECEREKRDAEREREREKRDAERQREREQRERERERGRD